VDTAGTLDYYAILMKNSVSLALLTTLCVLAPATGQGLRAQEPEGMSSIIPMPAKAEKPFAALSRALLGGRDSLVNLARQQVGLKYRLGAVSPGLAFDCSGLVKWVMEAFDVQLPRTAALQAQLGIEVPKDPARMLPGVLMFFGRGKRVTHIGIYVGEGKYVHAANRRRGVVESDLARMIPRWWKGVRRVLMAPDSGFGSKG